MCLFISGLFLFCFVFLKASGLLGSPEYLRVVPAFLLITFEWEQGDQRPFVIKGRLQCRKSHALPLSWVIRYGKFHHH